MCEICYAKYAGKWTPVTEYVRAAVVAIEDVYRESPVGGGLHMVIDDWNLDTDALESCFRMGVIETEADQICYDALTVLTENERATANAIARGWLSASGDPL